MTAPENNENQPKKFSFAPRGADDLAARNVVSGERQRRSLRNVILGGVLVISGAIISALVISNEKEIKVQVAEEKEEVKKPSSGLELKGLSYKGITSDGNDFIVLAETAIEDQNQPELVELKSPRARVDTTSGNPMTLRSLSGSFYRDQDRVDLNGRVVIVRPDIGYTLMTSDQEVRGFSPRARVRADGMVISERGENVLFTGKSTLRILTQQSN